MHGSAKPPGRPEWTDCAPRTRLRWMTKLDEELERAVATSEAEAPPETAVSKDAPSGASRPRRNLGLLMGLVVMGGGALALVLSSGKEASVYSKGVDELLAQKERFGDRNVRVDGILVKGSLMRRDQPCEYRFRMTKNGKELPVRYAQCV